MFQQTICSAFSDGPFSGNLAATIIADDFPAEQFMQNIAMSNNLPETTFLVPINDEFHIRWFTPTRETVMAGHATLAAAYTVIEQPAAKRIERVTFRWGADRVVVWKEGDVLWMEFPKNSHELSEPSEDEAARILQLTELPPCPIFTGLDVVAVLPSEEAVRRYRPRPQRLLELPGRGFAITSAGTVHDYCSRFFCPRYGVPEDPVTGSSHAILAPYWAKRLARRRLQAWQFSPAGGLVFSRMEDSRTLIGGKARLYSKAELFV